MRLAILTVCSFSRSEDGEERYAREVVTRELGGATGLDFKGTGYPADGGSISFWFRTDQGFNIELTALHWNKSMGGNPMYQEFRISDHSKGDCELLHFFILERRVLALLETLTPKNPGTRDRERLDWLILRLKDRTLAMKEFPRD